MICKLKLIIFALIYLSITLIRVELATIQVATSTNLTNALKKVSPGDTIILADGTYTSYMFTGAINGTPTNPITVTGSKNAILTSGDLSRGYGFHLTANYWILNGFAVNGSSKGIVLDGANFNVISNVSVSNIGAEAVHFRCYSSDNTIEYSQITNTGQYPGNQGYGEGNRLYLNGLCIIL